jgi:hypothetical protein
MDKETLRMQMLAGVITEGQYKAKLEEATQKDSLNEHMIGGIVGVGAINQIPSRAKTDYEMAFEHFLGEKYELKPNKGRADIIDVNENMLAAGNEVKHPEGTGTIELVTDYASHADEIDADLGMDWESMTPKEELTWYKIKGDDGETYWFDEEELSEFN